MKTQFLEYFNKFEKIIIILILLYSGGAWLFRPPTDSLAIEPTKGGLATIINIGIYIITFILIIVRWKRFLYTFSKEKLLLLIVGFAILSLFWSVSPDASENLIKGTIRITVLGIYLSARYNLREQMNLWAWTFGIAAVISLLYCLIFPNFGIQVGSDSELRGWRGIFNHKNHLGRQMSFGCSIFLILALKKLEYRWLLWILFGVSFSLLILSSSKTALLCFVVSLFLFPLIKFLRQSQKLILFTLTPVVLVMGGLIMSFLFNLENILNVLGKDMTFTGRVPLWTYLLENLAEKPWFGYGYNAFWPSVYVYIEHIFTWEPGQAHNGFLEVALSIGIVGVSLLLLDFIVTYYKAIILARAANTAETFWPLQFITIILVTNLFVASTFLEATVYWMLYVTTAFSLSLEYNRLRKH